MSESVSGDYDEIEDTEYSSLDLEKFKQSAKV